MQNWLQISFCVQHFFPQQELPLPFQIKVQISIPLMSSVDRKQAAVVGQVSEGQESLMCTVFVNKQGGLGKNTLVPGIAEYLVL